MKTAINNLGKIVFTTASTQFSLDILIPKLIAYGILTSSENLEAVIKNTYTKFVAEKIIAAINLTLAEHA